MPNTWKAPQDVLDLLDLVRDKNHQRLAAASIAVTLTDSKPFVKNRFNWGSVKKFSPANKIWQSPQKDICMDLCADIWGAVLNQNQREPFLDLYLTRIDPQYEPEVIVENGKKIVVKDEFGRIKYTDVVKTDDEGRIKWVISPLDLIVFTKNVKRYGLWCEELSEFKEAIVGG